VSLSVSVIFSTHDRPESLARAVAAALAQTRRPDELIVVCDGAGGVPDSVAAQAARAGVAFQSARQPVACLPASRNRGVAMAHGDVVLLADDDVLLPEDYLQRLLAMYEADPAGQVAVIGGVLVGPARGWAGRLYAALADGLARNRWARRCCAARYVRLPAALRGRLKPAERLQGGAISARRAVVAAEPFDESLPGYALGEDLEFCWRVGRRHAAFVASELRARHEVSAGGRPDPAGRGRMYVRNMLHIADRLADGAAGTRVVLGLHLGGAIVQGLAWAAARPGRGHLALAGGMVRELGARLVAAVRRTLCG